MDPKFGTLRVAATSLLSVSSVYLPFASGREDDAVTLSTTRAMSSSCATGTAPFAQFHGVVEPFMYTVNSGGTLPPGLRTSATRSVVPPLLLATLPVLSP